MNRGMIMMMNKDDVKTTAETTGDGGRMNDDV